MFNFDHVHYLNSHQSVFNILATVKDQRHPEDRECAQAKKCNDLSNIACIRRLD